MSFIIIFGTLSFSVVATDGVIGSLMTQKEYIIPLAFDSKSFSLFNKNLPANQQSPIREGISSLEQSVSIRPRVLIDRSAALSKYAAEVCVRNCKKGSPYSTTERRVPELVPVLGSQPAGDVSHKPGGRQPLLSARHAVTPATLKRAAISFAAW